MSDPLHTLVLIVAGLLFAGTAHSAGVVARAWQARRCHGRRLDFIRRNYRTMRDGRDASRMDPLRYADEGVRR